MRMATSEIFTNDKDLVIVPVTHDLHRALRCWHFIGQFVWLDGEQFPIRLNMPFYGYTFEMEEIKRETIYSRSIFIIILSIIFGVIWSLGIARFHKFDYLRNFCLTI